MGAVSIWNAVEVTGEAHNDREYEVFRSILTIDHSLKIKEMRHSLVVLFKDLFKHWSSLAESHFSVEELSGGITNKHSGPIVQDFKLSLPMDILHLQALLSNFNTFHALDGYLIKLVEKTHLHPHAPPLTRFKETMFPIVMKKVVESIFLDEEVDEKLKGLTTVKLCVRLNTLQYMQKQINILEDGIKKSWASTMASENSIDSKIPSGATYSLHIDSESVDELFIATFDSIRDSVADAIRKICDLVGTRVVFWDLRDSFLFRLYHGTVEESRMENVLPQIDRVLNHVCSLIDDTLRDMVVASICRAALGKAMYGCYWMEVLHVHFLILISL